MAVFILSGTFQSAGVIQAAYELNCPLQVHSLEMPTGVPVRKEFVSIDTPSVILETLKKVFLPIVIQYTAVTLCLYCMRPDQDQYMHTYQQYVELSILH